MADPAVPMSLASFIAAVGQIFTAAIGWLGDISQAIAADGILTAFVAIPLVGLGVGLFRRLLNIN